MTALSCHTRYIVVDEAEGRGSSTDVPGGRGRAGLRSAGGGPLLLVRAQVSGAEGKQWRQTPAVFEGCAAILSRCLHLRETT